METTPSHDTAPGAAPAAMNVKVFGVGNAGLNALEELARSGLANVPRVAINTDSQSLIGSTAGEKICLEPKAFRGLGTGGDPERGRAIAQACQPQLKAACEGVQVALIVAGLGGGVGTGVTPLLAQAAREAGALVLVFATLPFDCEGNRRRRQAAMGLEELKSVADGVICLPNQSLFKLIDENTTVLDTFKRSDELLSEGITHVWRLSACKGLIEIHFEDLCAFLRDRRGESHFATAEAAGATRSREVIDKLLSHPMLDNGRTLAESGAVLVSIIGGADLTMAEINRVMEHINAKCTHAQIIMGAAMDEAFQDRLAVTLVAHRKGDAAPVQELERETSRTESIAATEGLDTQLHTAPAPRSQSRFVPPPPAMSPERMEQLMVRQGGNTRGARKTAAKMRQGQLPLEIVSKGRFDKSEPTIHKGEDLDVPTYIRRGVALN